jgi:triphosphoribosyl-dephospho-CoA synthase
VTTAHIDDRLVADLFLAACRAELTALKPGNVHIHASGHGMEARHFEAAALAAAPHVAAHGRRVGERVLGAVTASLAAAGCNTNLGILLLCVPLAVAAEEAAGRELPVALADVLAGLDAADAEATFAAIATASPGGLGTVPHGDVRAPGTLMLQEAMGLAADRDRIARAYSNGFADIFSIALPALRAARRLAASEDLAITTLHLSLLASFPDSHVARKLGLSTALALQDEALAHRALWLPVARPETFAPLMAFDASLKARGINPGTTADFVVATLFTDALEVHLSATGRQSRLV